jgi:hypothetical protein
MGQTTRLADIALTFVAEQGVARIYFKDISDSDLKSKPQLLFSIHDVT